MSGHNQSHDEYAALVAGNNVLVEPASASTIDLKGQSGAVMVVGTATALTLPKAPIGTRLTIVSTSPSIVVTDTGSGTLSLTIADNEIGFFICQNESQGDWAGVLLKDGTIP